MDRVEAFIGNLLDAVERVSRILEEAAQEAGIGGELLGFSGFGFVVVLLGAGGSYAET